MSLWEHYEQRFKLYDFTLASAGTFDVSSISQEYDHLFLECLLRGDTVAAVSMPIYIYMNNDTTAANYHHEYDQANEAAGQVGEAATPTIALCPGAGSPANGFSIVRIFIPFYTSTTFTKIAEAFYTCPSNGGAIIMAQRAVWWEDGGATAINRITLLPASGDDFVTGSRLVIIGAKYL